MKILGILALSSGIRAGNAVADLDALQTSVTGRVRQAFFGEKKQRKVKNILKRLSKRWKDKLYDTLDKQGCVGNGDFNPNPQSNCARQAVDDIR